MAEYIKTTDAITTTWMILRGMGYAAEDNPDMVKTVAAVFNTAPAADVVERPRWIPVTERLPRGGENVLAYYHNPYNQFIVCATWDSKRHEWIPDPESIDGYYITAWMPLPEPPKDEVSE